MSGLIPPSSVPSPYSSAPYASAPLSVTNQEISGTIPPLATNYNNDGCYFVKVGDPVGDLVSTVNVYSSDLTKTATIDVENGNGSIVISPAANPGAAAPAREGLTLLSGFNGIVATLGDPTIGASPILQLTSLVDNLPNYGQVFDSYYNKPFNLSVPININWILSSPSDGILVSTGGSSPIAIPQAGFYLLQLNITMPGNQTGTSFPSAAGQIFRMMDQAQNITYGGFSITGSQLFTNFSSITPPFPQKTCVFSFSTVMSLPAATLELITDGYNGPLVFGPNMRSATNPTAFQFSLFKIN